MPVGGYKLSIEEALALCHVVGFRQRDELVTTVAIMTAESGRTVEAWNVNTNGSIDRGLFQINTIHKSLGMADSFRAVPNATFAFVLSNGGENFSPWNTFKSGTYEQFTEDVLKVFRADEWRKLIATIEVRLI